MPAALNMRRRSISPVEVSAYTAVSAVGVGRAAMTDAAGSGLSGLRLADFGATPLRTWIGRVPSLETTVLPGHLKPWDCRNNRLAWLGLTADGFLDQASRRCRDSGFTRVGVVVGTSTSSIGSTEEAFTRLDAHGDFPSDSRNPRLHTLHSLAAFVQEAVGARGPCMTLSTACSGGAKAFAVAERWLRLGCADAVVVGGVDSLCGSVLYGFNALRLLSPSPCRPFDAARDGISLGEAAAFALLLRPRPGSGRPRLLGYGEASDAHHLSAPHPEGSGAEQALDAALARAGLETDAIDYLHLHGTASRQNDDVEFALVARRYHARTHASSTKGLTGHTLGTAGAMGAVFSLLALETGLMPGTANTQVLDPSCPAQVRLSSARGRVRVAASHAFGFGGSNCVLIFGGALPAGGLV